MAESNQVPKILPLSYLCHAMLGPMLSAVEVGDRIGIVIRLHNCSVAMYMMEHLVVALCMCAHAHCA